VKRLFVISLIGLALSPTHLEPEAEVRLLAVRRAETGPLGIIPDEVIVGFGVTQDMSRIERAMLRLGAHRARPGRFGGPWLVSLPTGMPVDYAVEQLLAMPEVEWAEPNGRVSAFLAPNDRFFEFQWHMRMIGAERTWDIQRGDPSVVVAVLDTGIAYEDFGVFAKAPDWGETTFVEGFNVFDGSIHANDDNFHGTHVASTISEATNNSIGVAGLAFQTALMPVKVLNADGFGSFFGVAEGIDYAVNFRLGGDNPVKVINLSLGGDFESRALQEAIDAATAAGILVVAAAGNDGRDGVSFPASLPNVIAVGAVDASKGRASYSNFGEGLDLMAPGGDLDRDDNGDDRPDGVLQQTFSPRAAALEGRFDAFAFFFVDGTSQATPHVAAVAALLFQQGITDPAAIRAALESTAEDLGDAGRDDQFGHGLIRPGEALSGLGLSQ